MEPQDDLKAKFFSGWIDEDSIKSEGWFDAMLTEAKIADAIGMELLVLRVPKGKRMATAIEQFLQTLLIQDTNTLHPE